MYPIQDLADFLVLSLAFALGFLLSTLIFTYFRTKRLILQPSVARISAPNESRIEPNVLPSFITRRPDLLHTESAEQDSSKHRTPSPPLLDLMPLSDRQSLATPPDFMPLAHLFDAEPDQDAPDVLTQIRGITPELALELNRIGVATFRQIAEWSATDVRRVAAALALGNKIWEENWVVQAQSLYFESPRNQFRFGRF